MPHPWEDKWIVGERLGKGGQGLTNLVTPKVEGPAQAAIKVLKNNKDQQARGRMATEVVSLRVLATAGGAVPHVIDDNSIEFEDENIELYVVMEYIAGPTLREVIAEQKKLPLDLAARLVLKLCETIELAHGREILHRDLKPENIIARDLDSADVVVVDYGLSFNKESPDVTVTEDTFRNRFLDLPETNTPGGNRRDTRSDVTATCAILYYLLTGNVPGQLQDGNGRPPHLRPGYSLKDALVDDPRIAQFESLLSRGFAPSADSRFQTINEFRERLNLALSDTSVSVVADPFEIARAAAIELRKSDRVTQLNEFKKPAKRVIEELKKDARQYERGLERYSFEIADFSPGKHSLGEIDIVNVGGFQMVITPHNHSCSRYNGYLIGSKGEECVVLQRLQARDKDKVHVTQDWKEVLWFATDSTPNLDAIMNRNKSWVGESINELLQVVLNAPTTS